MSPLYPSLKLVEDMLLGNSGKIKSALRIALMNKEQREFAKQLMIVNGLRKE